MAKWPEGNRSSVQALKGMRVSEEEARCFCEGIGRRSIEPPSYHDVTQGKSVANVSSAKGPARTQEVVFVLDKQTSRCDGARRRHSLDSQSV